MIQKKNRHREISHTPNSIKLFNTRLKPVLGTIIKTLSTFLPVLFLGCTRNADPNEDRGLMQVCVSGSTKAGAAHRLDIFTFNDDKLMHLDSYQRTEGRSDGNIDIRSQNGNKVIFVCANSTRDRYGWADINSFNALGDIHMDLSEERRTYPVMTGTAHVTAGNGQTCKIDLSPLTCEVHLRSLACSIRNAEGKSARLEDIRIYLTNVNSLCSLTAEEISRPMEIMNAGKLDEEALEAMTEPDMIMQKIAVSIGETPYRADIRLLCYPNSCESEGPGTPFTRLVIEGRIDGQTYWWPININRGNGIKNPGVHRNCRYTYDIILKRKGASDPDTAMETGDADINLDIRQWNEKENYSVCF